MVSLPSFSVHIRSSSSLQSFPRLESYDHKPVRPPIKGIKLTRKPARARESERIGRIGTTENKNGHALKEPNTPSVPAQPSPCGSNTYRKPGHDPKHHLQFNFSHRERQAISPSKSRESSRGKVEKDLRGIRPINWGRVGKHNGNRKG